ncbi:hypothetical protein [Salipiger aestuarii]|uniref:hypothetical protein n=1 Tax=Salipiger aestuarii TaxID=568098 RepID=UPI00123C40D7|nr:hypothetical protein [Salipiger aestuarii]
MQFTGVLPALAPLATGHPQGLPDPADGPPPVTRVQPVAEQADIGADPGTDREPPSEARQLQSRQTPERSAPPSVIQIRIAKMLQDQAEKLATDRQPPPAGGPDLDQTTPAIEPADTAETPDTDDDSALPTLSGSTAPAPAHPEPDTAAPQQDALPLPIPYGARADLSQTSGGGAGVDKTT